MTFYKANGQQKISGKSSAEQQREICPAGFQTSPWNPAEKKNMLQNREWIQASKKNLFFTNLLITYPKKRLVILNKISKFGENSSLWQVIGLSEKSCSKIKEFSEGFRSFHSLDAVDTAMANIFVPSFHTPAQSWNCFPPITLRCERHTGWISEHLCSLKTTSSPNHSFSGTTSYFVSYQRLQRFQVVAGSSKKHLCPHRQFQEILLLNFPGSWETSVWFRI